MSFAPGPVRPARHRRRRPLTCTVESLETRQLLAVAPVTLFAPTTNLHAQHLRLMQFEALMAPATRHVATQHVATQHVATAGHGQARPAATPAHAAMTQARRHPLNDFVVYHPDSGSDGEGGDISPDAGGPQAVYTPVLTAYTPSQVRTAYGVNTLGAANQGQGMTIAIVDEFDDTAIANDASVFSAQYNLPQLDGQNGNPTLTVYKDQALGTVTSAAGTGVAGETALDVEWAHAIAPMANILLVEVPASGGVANQFAQLLHGVQYAAGQPGVVAVSLSYGYPEANIGSANVIAQDAAYLASAPVSNVAVTVSSGDYSTALFPATSPNVVAVGGSSLYLASARGRYSFESAWGGLNGAGSGGGGLSTNFAAPAYQTGAGGLTYTRRAIPDVSLIADPVTGVSTYDSLDVTASAPNPWGDTGGTSLAAPVFAGMIALAQQNRVVAGLPILNSAQINNDIYALYNSPGYSTYFRDIALGNNNYVTTSRSGRVTTTVGYNATAGYDLATGVGSPIASTFVPYLSSPSA